MAQGEGGRTGKVVAREEKGASLSDDVAGTVDVGDGVLVSGTVEAGGNVLEGDVVLVPHAAKGREGVMDEGNVVKNKT